MAHKLKGKEDEEDVSMLRTPIQLHGKAVEQILNSVHYGTPELRSLLLDECDIIFECKVCRALFRDLANLTAHKRRYCSKSAAEDNYLALSRIPDEKVYYVQPQEPKSSTPSVVRMAKSRSKPSLDETIARIQSGELGHSHAFKVYSDAAQKLQRQKEEMKVATIRTRAIPTNSNAVFVDVNMASVNIHERQAAPTSSSSVFNSGTHCPSVKRKAKERMNANKNRSPSKRVRILRKDCKNSEELNKLLIKELKEIQVKAKQKVLPNDSAKQPLVKGQLPKVKKISSGKETTLSSSKTAIAMEKDGNSSDTGLIAIDRHRPKATPTKIEPVHKLDKLTPPKVSNGESNGVSSAKKKTEIPAETTVSTQERSPDCKTPSPLPDSKYKLRKKSLICQKCRGIFSSRQSLSFHNKIIHSPKKTFFPCLYCPSVFYYFYGVTRHLRMNHSKSKTEVNFLRRKLRAKAYTKVLPQVKEDTDMKPRLTGLRKSLRYKQEAFSSETSPTSSYVLHSVKKMGKKLSAKKDAMSAPLPKEQTKESDTSNEKVRTSVSSPIADLRNVVVKKEVESLSKKRLHNDALASSTKDNTSERKLGTSTVSPKSFSPRQLIMHTCKKCRRKFGRVLTYKNHIKVCQGEITVASTRRRIGRPLRNLYIRDYNSGSVLSTRRKFRDRTQKTPVSRAITNNFIALKQTTPSNQNTRSSNKQAIKSDSSVRQEDCPSAHSNACNRGRNSLRRQWDSESESSRSRDRNPNTERSCSVPNFAKATNFIKSESLRSKSIDKPVAENPNIAEFKREENATENLSHDDLPVIPISEKISKVLIASSSVGSVNSEIKIMPQKDSVLKSDVTTSSPQAKEEDEKINDGSSSASKEDGPDGDKTHTATRSTRGVRGASSSICDFLMPKTRSSLGDVNRDKRSTSVEKDVRSRISHLVPRASGDVFAAAKRDVSSSVSVPSTSPIEERPRRKRKVPTRNMDAMEMLSKIHNPEKDGPPCKKLEITPNKPTRGRPRKSGVKSKTVRIKEEDGPKDTESQSERRSFQEIKEGRFNKNRSRIFVLGRAKPRTRKVLRSYDNARVDKLIDIQNTKCLVCGEQCSQIYNLRRHVIRIHLQWSRYQCKLCRFASFDRSECTTHIVRNHRRAVNIEDTLAVNSCITDLAKQGSQVMNRKKNQTLRDKNRLQNKEANIYARPNMRKMPRLAERTLMQEKEETQSLNSRSTQGKQKVDSTVSQATHMKVVRHSTRTESIAHEVSDDSSRRNSLPFNISTRNSPRMFDTRPYKSSATSNANAQGELAMLHTRKGIYTKTIPAIPGKDKPDSDSKEMPAKGSISVETKGGKDDIMGNTASEVEPYSDSDSPKKHILDKMGLASIALNHDVICPSDSTYISYEVRIEKNQSLAGEAQGEQTVISSSDQCGENKVISGKDKMTANGEAHDSNPTPQLPVQLPSVKPVSNGPTTPTASSLEPKLLRNYKTVDSEIFLKMDDPHHSGTRVPSSSANASLCVSDPSNSSNMIRISPSYVVIKSARIPSTVRVSSGSVSKTLNFSQTFSKAADSSSAHSHSSASDHVGEPLSETTLLDDDIGDVKNSSPVSALSETSPEQTQATITDVQDL